jgi:hypothetical protein
MLARDRPKPASPANLVGYDRVIFLIVIGMAFVWFGFHFFAGLNQKWFFAVLGGAFVAFGISQLFLTRRLRK